MMATNTLKVRVLPLMSALTVVISSANLAHAGTLQTDTSDIALAKTIPRLEFANVQNSDSKTFSTSDLRGKPTIIYFLSAVCKSSFSQLKKIDSLYSLHKNDLNLLMVGIDLNDNIQSIYDRYRDRYNLALPITFDKTIYKQFSIKTVPYVIWINENRIVQAVTNVLDPCYLKTFMQGLEFNFIDYTQAGRKALRDFDPNKPFFSAGNSKLPETIIYGSMLCRWRIGMPEYMPWADSNEDPLGGIEQLHIIGRELADLYRTAYFGKTYAWHSDDSAYGNYHFSPILEIRDKSKFESNFDIGENLFCYSQTLPPEKRDPSEMMRAMQLDLKNYFGYDATVETRMMPYLALTANTTAKKQLIHHENSTTPHSSSSLIHANLARQPILHLISIISYNLNLVRKDLPLVNETGISADVDLKINCIMTDFEDIRDALRSHGMDLVKKNKPMRVLVVRDPKNHP